MSKQIKQSVLHVVGCENLLNPNELTKIDNKTISELLHEQKEKESNQKKESSNIKPE
jgi:hypothetical protein